MTWYRIWIVFLFTWYVHPLQQQSCKALWIEDPWCCQPKSSSYKIQRTAQWMSYLPFCESIHSKHPIVHRQLVCPFWSLLAFHEVQRVVHEALRDEYCQICPATCWSFPWQHPIETVSNPVATLDDGHALIVLTICFWSLSILAFTSASAFLCSSSLGFLTCDGSTGGVRVAGGVVVAVVVAVVDSAMMRASSKGTRVKEKVE